MFKYAILTKMEVLNLSLGGPDYSALLFVKMLGEQLFPLVKSIEHDFAGKLLEMDKTEVLHLLPRCFEEKSFRSHGRFGANWTHVLRRFLTSCFLANFFMKLVVSVHVKVSSSSGLLDMFKYAISTKMEVLNLSLGGPNYSALLFVKGFIKKIISQEHGAYNLVELLCKDGHGRYP
ncbi:hypothetical protein C5167_047524 [Papaver somniferum]|uniref:PABC domain-containing protein n=1 Tax=Papaver somniferum TaxID=3469 RepID=A0A4Y7LJF2_PAPSO|nr:uncharacterized protein LOC113322971 [Papaver somniferum]RZC84740.1 hypothetical protein C5167_047524 [Papaver somniferum]